MVWGKGPNSSFSMWISNCHSTICWKEYPFPQWKLWHFCQKSSDHLFLDSQSCSIDLYVNPHCKTCCLYRCSFSVSFKIGNCKFFTFAPLKNCFGYFVSFAFPYTFYDQIANFCPPEIHSHFDRNCIQSINPFGEYWHLNNIESSHPWTLNFSPFI